MTSDQVTISFTASQFTQYLPEDIVSTAGSSVTLPDMVISSLLKQFKCWILDDESYEAGDTFTVPSSDVTFTAEFEAKESSYTIVQMTYDNSTHMLSAASSDVCVGTRGDELTIMMVVTITGTACPDNSAKELVYEVYVRKGREAIMKVTSLAYYSTDGVYAGLVPAETMRYVVRNKLPVQLRISWTDVGTSITHRYYSLNKLIFNVTDAADVRGNRT